MIQNHQTKASILVIGNEILSGRTKDKNIGYIAEKLTENGINLLEARIIADSKEEIKSNILELSSKYDYVFTSGGIGPTHDDITTESIAYAFNLELEMNKEALKRLKNHYYGTDIKLNSARKKMAIIPKSATLIDNPVSAAPGFKINNVYVMAGIPRIMQSMLDNILSNLKKGPKNYSQTISCSLGEGNVAEGIKIIQNDNPNVDIGCYPYFKAGNFGVSIVIRSINKAEIKNVLLDVKNLIIKLGGEPKIITN